MSKKVDSYKYNPSLSVAKNAKNNGVSKENIRYYIKTRNINRRLEAKINIAEDIRKFIKVHPDAAKTEIARCTGYSINTVKKYWTIVVGNANLEQSKIGEKIAKKRLREYHNFYATHPSCICDILRVETFNHFVLEPFCGIGSISEVLKEYGYEVESYDIIDRGYGKIGYLSGLERFKSIYQIHPPARVYVYMERICIARNADFEKYNDPGANREIYAWYIWQKDYTGATELHWIHNDRTR